MFLNHLHIQCTTLINHPLRATLNTYLLQFHGLAITMSLQSISTLMTNPLNHIKFHMNHLPTTPITTISHLLIATLSMNQLQFSGLISTKFQQLNSIAQMNIHQLLLHHGDQLAHHQHQPPLGDNQLMDQLHHLHQELLLQQELFLQQDLLLHQELLQLLHGAHLLQLQEPQLLLPFQAQDHLIPLSMSHHHT
jgi:hypothetical protein